MMIEKVDKDVDKLQNSQSNQNLNNDNLKKQY